MNEDDRWQQPCVCQIWRGTSTRQIRWPSPRTTLHTRAAASKSRISRSDWCCKETRPESHSVRARRSRRSPGGARRSQEEPRRSPEEPGGAGRSPGGHQPPGRIWLLSSQCMHTVVTGILHKHSSSPSYPVCFYMAEEKRFLMYFVQLYENAYIYMCKWTGYLDRYTITTEGFYLL